MLDVYLKEHGYELKRCIGQGHYGRAYLVNSLRYSQDFVCKYIPLRKHVPLEEQRREIDALQLLIHPNIMSIYDWWEGVDHICFIGEYCEKGGYDKFLESNGPMSLEEFKKTAKQLLSALYYLHSKGFSHNDIKPANILIDFYGRPKLADFGLCAISSNTENETISRGTPITMAPEIHLKKPYNPFKSDIWSLGVTFYIMLTGKNPFGSSSDEIRANSVRGFTEYPKSMDDNLKKLLTNMIQVDPSKRLAPNDLLAMPFFSCFKKATITKCKSSHSFFSHHANVLRRSSLQIITHSVDQKTVNNQKQKGISTFQMEMEDLYNNSLH